MINSKALIENIKRNAYPVHYDRNSVELGMTLTGIQQAIDEMPKYNWMDAKDGLPEQRAECIVTMQDSTGDTWVSLAAYCPECDLWES